jgi:hypothetical protein
MTCSNVHCTGINKIICENNEDVSNRWAAAVFIVTAIQLLLLLLLLLLLSSSSSSSSLYRCFQRVIIKFRQVSI